MLKTLLLATLLPLLAVLATAAVAVNLGDLLALADAGPADDRRRLLAIAMLFLPVGLTLVISECVMLRRCRLFGRK